MARVLFFGRLRDQAGVSERDVGLDRATDIASFRRLAAGGDEELAMALAAPTVRTAVNSAIAPRSDTCVVAPNDEVAFMPPFSGG